MAKTQITKEQVEHIAELSNLNISGQEQKMAELLSDTLDYIDVLDELDTSGVDPTFQVTGLNNEFQEDAKQKATLTKEEALSNAKEVRDGLFATEAVLER